MKVRAEYIWIDGSEPIREVRSKTRILDESQIENPPLWGFDGSSTYQANSKNSDVILNAVFTCPDPIRGGRDILVLCETLDPNKNADNNVPHYSNTRVLAVNAFEKFRNQKPWFGLEQEFTLLNVATGRPAGFPTRGFPEPQGRYYCGVGAVKIVGRSLIEEHTKACLDANLSISGTNAEVMPGQWEFQIGPEDPVAIGDQIWMARYLLFRLAEEHDVEVSMEAKPVKGDWNGAGMHCNFSTELMRNNYEAVEFACKSLGQSHARKVHLDAYGDGTKERLTGEHETQHFDTFTWGVGDRGASIRIPANVKQDGGGYFEDRRPNANADPYLLAATMTKTVCTALLDFPKKI